MEEVLVIKRRTEKSDALIERRKKVVPEGVGIFVPSTVETASNGTLTDVDGNELIDFVGGIGAVNAGHCPKPVVKAIQQQAEKLLHACFHISTYEPYVALCEKLVDLFPHGGETKAMLTNTGAESVENAIKIARQATKRQAVVCFSEAFHGRSMMAMSLTSKINYKFNCGPFAPEVYRVPFPNYFKNGRHLTEDQYIEQEIRRLGEAMIGMVNPHDVAAIIIELVQGEGGFYVAPKEYIKQLRAFCDKHGILLIFDEVQSGFGRTGKWASYHHYDVTPDVSTWAKSMGSGMPIGAVIGKAEIMDKALPGTIGGTYLGNPVCCASALATIQYMEEYNINERAMEISHIVFDRFNKLKIECSAIGDVRGLGAMQAIEFNHDNDPNQPNSEIVSKVTASCLEKGLIVLSAGAYKNVIRILSPLTISDDLLIKGLDIIEEEILKHSN